MQKQHHATTTTTNNKQQNNNALALNEVDQLDVAVVVLDAVARLACWFVEGVAACVVLVGEVSRLVFLHVRRGSSSTKHARAHANTKYAPSSLAG
jgi:hypothetical protein